MSSSQAAAFTLLRGSSAEASLLRTARAFSLTRVIEMRCASSEEAWEMVTRVWFAYSLLMALKVSLAAAPQEPPWASATIG